jgi:Ni,Fe-hydrogenase III component G
MMLSTMDKPKVGQKYVAAIREQFGLAVQEESWQAPDQVTITVDLNSMPAVVESLYYQHGGWLSTVAANDERPLNGHFALYYVLSVEGNDQEHAEGYGKCYMMVRALVPPLQPEFPAVSPRIVRDPAGWHARRASPRPPRRLARRPVSAPQGHDGLSLSSRANHGKRNV